MTGTPVDGAAAELLRLHRYAGLGVITPYLPGLDADDRQVVLGLCRFAERVIELDAEDFATLRGVPAPLLAMVRGAHMPNEPRAADRGALRSLVSTYRLFLEVLHVRWARREQSSVLAVLHLMAEYLPLLVWEEVLGHAGDPLRLAELTDVPGSRWGTDSRACDHPPGLRRLLRRATMITEQDEEQWERYLDREHSRVSAALGQCASHHVPGRAEPSRVCRRPCSLWTQLPAPQADLIERRMTLAATFTSSPVLALRHAAPVGHGFGVPSRAELQEEWRATWVELTAAWVGSTNPFVVPLEGPDHPVVASSLAAGPLPGLAEFLSCVAGVAITPLGVLDEVDALLSEHLQGDAAAPDIVAR